MKEKVAVLSHGIGASVDAAGHISSAVGGWWGTITRITALQAQWPSCYEGHLFFIPIEEFQCNYQVTSIRY